MFGFFAVLRWVAQALWRGFLLFFRKNRDKGLRRGRLASLKSAAVHFFALMACVAPAAGHKGKKCIDSRMTTAVYTK